MKVLVLTSAYPNNIWPNDGVFIKERISAFARLDGCRVKVIAPVPYFPPIKLGWRQRFSRVAWQEVIEGLDVYHPRYFMTPKVGMSLYGLEMFLSAYLLVRKIQREFDFDLISAHTIYPEGFAGVLLGLFFEKPVVVSARGTDIHLFPKFPLIRQLIKFTLMKSHKVISVCQAFKDEMIRLGVPQDKISVIPNGVDPDKFYPISKADARKRLDLPMDKTILLSVGSLISIKGFDLLIRSLRILFDEFHQQNLYLVIVGEGRLKRDLERLTSSLKLEENVYLAGGVPHRELNYWYNAVDLFCLASSREGWPNVLMESLACGTPVVGTAVWGIPEIIQSEEIGFLVNRSERKLAEGIYDALKRPWRPDAIIQYARENTWNRVALSVHQVFESVLKGKIRSCFDSGSSAK